MSKGCFVTVGATAAFDGLVAAALSSQSLIALRDAGYTRLVVQYGQAESSKSSFQTSLKKVESEFGVLPLHIEGFALTVVDFQEAVKDVVCTAHRGLLIAHAGRSFLKDNFRPDSIGTGSLMEGLALRVPTILVPNLSLADNHQAELADHFEKAGYCVHGDIRSVKPVAIKCC
jgi:beta-1,4-N-acetylglucosaminyltransferase